MPYLQIWSRCSPAIHLIHSPDRAIVETPTPNTSVVGRRAIAYADCELRPRIAYFTVPQSEIPIASCSEAVRRGKEEITGIYQLGMPPAGLGKFIKRCPDLAFEFTADDTVQLA